ncbi:MAG TPA: hypothetical protein VIE91_03735 [Methylophilaceae bacterium]
MYYQLCLTSSGFNTLYISLGPDVTSQQTAYRALFRSQMDDAVIADIRLALAQSQPQSNVET